MGEASSEPEREEEEPEADGDRKDGRDVSGGRGLKGNLGVTTFLNQH